MGRFGVPEVVLISGIMLVLFAISQLPRIFRFLLKSIMSSGKSMNNKEDNPE